LKSPFLPLYKRGKIGGFRRGEDVGGDERRKGEIWLTTGATVQTKLRRNRATANSPEKFPLWKRGYYTLPPLKKGDGGGFLKSPLTPLYERGENTPSANADTPLKEGKNTPTLSLPPLRGRMKVGGEKYKIIPLA